MRFSAVYRVGGSKSLPLFTPETGGGSRAKNRSFKHVKRNIEVSAENGEITFPFWNATLNADEVQTYITLARQMAEQAGTQKRVLAAEKPADNEKYAFRCFLLRLGFIGDEFRTERKVLLSRLSGNGAYRKGRAKAADGDD